MHIPSLKYKTKKQPIAELKDVSGKSKFARPIQLRSLYRVWRVRIYLPQ